MFNHFDLSTYHRLTSPRAPCATRAQRPTGKRKKTTEVEERRERERSPSGVEQGPRRQGVEIEMKTGESTPGFVSCALVNEGY